MAASLLLFCRPSFSVSSCNVWRGSGGGGGVGGTKLGWKSKSVEKVLGAPGCLAFATCDVCRGSDGGGGVGGNKFDWMSKSAGSVFGAPGCLALARVLRNSFVNA